MKAAYLAIVATVALHAASARAQADPRRGQRLYGACTACHAGSGSMGPDLVGVVGRKAGSRPNYRYSPALRGAGFIWTPAKLRAFLRDPATTVPGNRMPFGGLESDRDADDVVAYLAGRR